MIYNIFFIFQSITHAKHKELVCLFLCFLLFFATACSDNTSQKKVHKKAKTIKPTKKEEKQPGDNKTREVYAYDPAGKTDPFIPLVYEKKEGKKAAPTRVSSPQQRETPLTPLQRYNLDDLKLVAVIQGSQDNATALVEDPDGFGYIVRTGTLIGENNGVIKKVQDARIIIEQQYINPTGKKETKIATLEINYQNYQ